MFMTVIIFMRQTLTDDFWGLHKNKNYAFSLMNSSRYTNADSKISLYVRVQAKILLQKFRIPNPKNSRVIYP